jgi:hypothetical protein
LVDEAMGIGLVAANVPVAVDRRRDTNGEEAGEDTGRDTHGG